MNKYCVVCEKEFGPHMESHCTDRSLVGTKTEGVFNKRKLFFAPDGSELSPEQLSRMKESETRRVQTLKKRETLSQNCNHEKVIDGKCIKCGKTYGLREIVQDMGANVKQVRRGESNWTELIVKRIQGGMKITGAQLSSEEDNLLWSSVFDVASNPSLQEKAKAFNDKCIAALARAYDAEIETSKGEFAKKMAAYGVKPENPALLWRNMLESSVRANEDSVACAILQNWYASVGRSQEKKATAKSRNIMLLIILVAAVVLYALFVISC